MFEFAISTVSYIDSFVSYLYNNIIMDLCNNMGGKSSLQFNVSLLCNGFDISLLYYINNDIIIIINIIENHNTL